MRMANEQALAMAQHDTMNHDIGKPFKERVSSSPFANVVVVENVSAGYHTLAEAFSGWRDARRRHRHAAISAQSRRIAARHSPSLFSQNSKYKMFQALILAGDARPR